MKTISKMSRLAGLLAIVALTCGARDVYAHSFPQEQHPSAGQALAASPPQVTIKFDAPIEKLFAKLQVLDDAGKDHALGAPEVSSDGTQLSTKVEALKAGEYTVKWTVIGIDTHRTEGSYPFTVSGNGS